MPVYNRERYVVSALRSLVRQRDAADLDIIVIDDGSTDGSAEAVRSMMVENPCIRLFRQENMGVAKSTQCRAEAAAIGPASLDLAEGSATFVHAVGSATDGTLALVSFVIPGLHSAPGGVPAGTGPADCAVPTIALVVLLTLGLAVAGIGGRRLYLDRSL